MQKDLAFIFDMNGTMIDDMSYHTTVWHDLLTKDLGASLSLPEVKSHMYGKNEEVFERIFGKGYFTPEEMHHYSIEKEKRYQKIYLPNLKLIKGLEDFLISAHEMKIPMAIGTAAIPFNVNFVLDNLPVKKFFKGIVTAEDVKDSKPDPETFIKAAEILNSKPENCIVFEDSPKGAETALNAGMSCVAVLTYHDKKDFDKYPNVIQYIHNYTGLNPNTLNY